MVSSKNCYVFCHKQGIHKSKEKIIILEVAKQEGRPDVYQLK